MSRNYKGLSQLFKQFEDERSALKSAQETEIAMIATEDPQALSQMALKHTSQMLDLMETQFCRLLKEYY